MSIIKKSIGIILAAVLLVFIIQNANALSNDMKLQFLNGDIFTLQLKTGLWLLLFYLMGILSWMFMDAWRSINREKKIRAQKKEIKNLQAELEKLRPKTAETPAKEIPQETSEDDE